jgi:hypothetical protein
MDLPATTDPRDRWLALATGSFAVEIDAAGRDELRSLALMIDPARAAAMDDRLERLRRQLDAPRSGALHHRHLVSPEDDSGSDEPVPCDLLACWFPRSE